MITFCFHPIGHYWWKAEVLGEDFWSPWREEEDGEEDREQEGWELALRLIAAMASCWANRTPESQHGRVSIKVTIQLTGNQEHHDGNKWSPVIAPGNQREAINVNHTLSFIAGN